MKNFLLICNNLGGWFFLLMWLPTLIIFNSIIPIPTFISDWLQMRGNLNISGESPITSVLIAITFSATITISIFAWGLFLRAIASRSTRFGKITYILPLLAMFFCACLLMLSAFLASIDIMQVANYSIHSIAIMSVATFGLFAPLWLFKMYADTRVSNLDCLLAYLTIAIGLICILLLTFYMNFQYFSFSAISISIIFFATFLDIAFHGLGYKIFMRSIKRND